MGGRPGRAVHHGGFPACPALAATQPPAPCLSTPGTACISIRGAHAQPGKHRLDIPRHQLVVVTGLSGPGKSSLAFDTLYAEGQRCYAKARPTHGNFWGGIPDVDLIEGLSPAIAIEQKATSHNPRSTVARVTEIHDYLRLLGARRHRTARSTAALAAQTVSQMVDAILQLPEGTRLMLLARCPTKKGEFHELFTQMLARLCALSSVDGQLYVRRRPS